MFNTCLFELYYKCSNTLFASVIEDERQLTPTILSIRTAPKGVGYFVWAEPKSIWFFTSHENPSAWPIHKMNPTVRYFLLLTLANNQPHISNSKCQGKGTLKQFLSPIILARLCHMAIKVSRGNFTTTIGGCASAQLFFFSLPQTWPLFKLSDQGCVSFIC